MTSHTPEWQRMLTVMRSMSDADLSVLEACLLTADGHATTSAGSRNDMLWSHMEMLGWMSSREEVLDLPGGRQLRMRMFAVSALGRENIEQLLSAVAAERARS